MPRNDTLIIKDTHRGLLYEDGVFRDVLPAGRYEIPGLPSRLASFFGSKGPKVEVLLVDVRGRDRTVAVQDLLTADGATISATFAIRFRVIDPLAAVHRVKNYEDRLYSEAQTAARRVLRGLSVEEILASRDEVGEEMFLQIQEAAGDCGLEVLGVDFKDLIVPEDLRKLMNRAVLARKLREVRLHEGSAGDLADDDLAIRDENALEDDADLVIARARFDRDLDDDRTPQGRGEVPTIRPLLKEGRGHAFQASGFDGTLRRFRP